ncbi:ABC transporter permease subunit [Actinoplanes sp. NPDC023936]|uniref:ABC transporter permease subunit n=1 Tax=Actinoplanes sp. NPDC023936 TaxID=3154910 RepID=UPI0033ECCD06
MSLARAESRRLIKRRFTKVLLIGLLLVLAAVFAGSWFTSEKVGPSQIAAAKAEADGYYQEALRTAATDKQQCLAAAGTPQAANWPANCDELYTPTREDYDYRWYMPATFDLREDFRNMISVFAVVLAAVAFLIGASFVGAEWNSGGMMNLLLWRPQRTRVLGTKLIVFLSWLVGVSVLLGAVWAGLFRVLAEARGTTDKMTSGVWQSFGLMGLRGLGLIVAAGALGFALASLGRHTGMALGALVALGAVQIGVYVMAGLAGFKYPDLLFTPFWIFAVLYKEWVATDYTSCDYSSVAGCRPDTFTMTWQAGSIGVAAVAVLVVAAALWTMRKRDIT